MNVPRTIGAAGGIAAPGGRAAGEAYALLVFTMSCWGSNVVAGRLAVGEVSPMVITSLRWAIVAAVLSGAMLGRLRLAFPALRRDWRRIVPMAACGFTAFNALFYVAAHYTSAVNIAILQGAVPMFVLVGAVALHRARVGTVQLLGVAATLVGVAEVATKGSLGSLAGFRFGLGDALMLVACVLYAGYALALRRRPPVPNLVFFAAMAVVAFLTSLPLLGYEVVSGTVTWPTPRGWAIVLFIAVFPSFLSQVSFMRAVQLIGPSRAGLFTNLVPVIGAFLAVAVLDEPFALHDLIGLILVIAGILAAEAAGRMAQAPDRRR